MRALLLSIALLTPSISAFAQEAVIDTQNQQLELGDASDVQSLSVNLKIDLA